MPKTFNQIRDGIELIKNTKIQNEMSNELYYNQVELQKEIEKEVKKWRTSVFVYMDQINKLLDVISELQKLNELIKGGE